jgi:hypothetical protein
MSSSFRFQDADSAHMALCLLRLLLAHPRRKWSIEAISDHLKLSESEAALALERLAELSGASHRSAKACA